MVVYLTHLQLPLTLPLLCKMCFCNCYHCIKLIQMCQCRLLQCCSKWSDWELQYIHQTFAQYCLRLLVSLLNPELTIILFVKITHHAKNGQKTKKTGIGSSTSTSCVTWLLLSLNMDQSHCLASNTSLSPSLF